MPRKKKNQETENNEEITQNTENNTIEVEESGIVVAPVNITPKEKKERKPKAKSKKVIINEDHMIMKNELKKIYIGNQEFLKHLTIKKIDNMDYEEIKTELETAKLMLSNSIGYSITIQALQLINTFVSFASGVDGDGLNESVLDDENLLRTANNILNNEVLHYLNDKCQFGLLYSSKVLDEYKNKKKLTKNKRLTHAFPPIDTPKEQEIDIEEDIQDKDDFNPLDNYAFEDKEFQDKLIEMRDRKQSDYVDLEI